MKAYKKVLVALELNFGPEDYVINQIKSLKKRGADIYLVHALENAGNYGATYAASAGIDLEGFLKQEADNMMSDVAENLDIPKENRHIEVGLASKVVLDFAEEIKPDLIVVGSHGKHGIGLLLGSTANSVVHHATTDVLAVRAPA